jgi:diketogulonate reductase-like aldo/keto reductase
MFEECKKSLAQRHIPSFLYGTAWKEQTTADLTFTALSTGFWGIDTANQRKHYFEEAVGAGVKRFLSENKKTRQDIFLQTKFTFAQGQDHRKPYDESASFAVQLLQSFTSSLKHLQTDYIDSYILHGPYFKEGLNKADWEVWQAMENLFQQKQVKFLGISNITLAQLHELYQGATVKPTFVQNRCFAITNWDKEIRDFCRTHGLIYQAFSLLTANPSQIFSPFVKSLSAKYGKTVPQIIFRFAMQVGMLPLTGSTNSQHMLDDLNLSHFELSEEEVDQIENIARLA